MLFLYTYLKLGLWSMIYYFKPNETVFEIIVNNIKGSGPVLTKFVQWSLPKIETLYDIEKKEKDNNWFYKLEEVYEKCNFHSLDYTLDKYASDFHENFEKKYDEIEEIASGSIGQVYKIKDKKGNLFAMKILHPGISYQIYFFNLLFTIIKLLKPIHNYILYYFPIDLHAFIHDFKMQTDFVNEANNILAFSDTYKENKFIIIPQLYRTSKHIIIMSYEEGESFDKNKHSDYLNYKTISLLKLFNKTNETITNFIHGDLHKGNWKVRIKKSEVKLVILDFGFCWSLPEFISDNLLFINHVFMDIIVRCKSCDIDHNHIEEYSKVGWIFSEGRIPPDIIQTEIKKIVDEGKISCTDPTFFIRLLLESCRVSKKTMNSYVLNMLIAHIQTDQLYQTLIGDNFRENDKDYNERYILFKYFGDLINFCETNNMFIDYIDYLKNELEEEKKIRNIKCDKLFLQNEYLENNEKIKALCIQD